MRCSSRPIGLSHLSRRFAHWLLSWLLGAAVGLAEDPAILPSPAHAAWQKLELGMLVTFGLGTFLERESGDGQDSPARFNPVEFNARQWARAAASSGARMLMVTVKGPDGFCLWPSRWTEHSVRASPWREGLGDVVREVATACRETGLRLGLWFPLRDRHEPSAANASAYNCFLQRQLAELLTDYGEVAELWLDDGDGDWDDQALKSVDFGALLQLARHLQPRMVVTGAGPDARSLDGQAVVLRDEETSVQRVGTEPWWSQCFSGQQQVWRPLERLVSLRPSPFYRTREDGRLLSLAQLTDAYLRSVGRNTFLLLNVPATPRGLIAEGDVRRLVEFGAACRALSGNGGWETSGEGLELVLTLTPPREIGALVAEEDIARGELVKRFLLETREAGGGEWQVAHEGRVLGRKQIVQFTARRLEAVRLRVLESSNTPVIRRLAACPAP